MKRKAIVFLIMTMLIMMLPGCSGSTAPAEGDNYRSFQKRFNGSYWEETDEPEFRDPKHKTVYCIGSYAVQKVALYVNRRQVGLCERPESGFVQCSVIRL